MGDIKTIELTDEMNLAIDAILSEDKTPIYITGKAGTGKTTLLKHIIKNLGLRVAVAAPTGIAAINAEGVTLHSLFQIPFGIPTERDVYSSQLSQNKEVVLNCIDVLIIDEISMVNPAVLDFVSMRLQETRGDFDPFGGVKVVMFGDLYQLPPVVKKDEKEILSRMYKDVYFFNSNVISECGLRVFELNKVFRQSDKEFIDLLNNVREYRATNDDLNWLAETRDLNRSSDYNGEAIHICALKREASKINTEMLGKHSHTYNCTIIGDFSQSSCPAEVTLNLREGARVMTLINDPNKGFYNGSLGTVVGLDNRSVDVKLDKTGEVVNITQASWSEFRYNTNEKGELVKEEKGTFVQLPLSLAWAITVHKSQGLTFDKVVLHLSRVFASGQLYVALSRCRSIEGITTNSFVFQHHIIPNDALVKFEMEYRANNMYFGKCQENEGKQN